MTDTRVTRGYGLLEDLLARRRAAMVESLIPPNCRNGCIVDIGCGSYPGYLLRTKFSRKIAIDKSLDQSLIEALTAPGLQLVRQDLEQNPRLPLNNESCDVATMTAALEHFDPSKVPIVLTEIVRVLKPQGVLIVTTPPPWTHALLDIMAKIRLVSAVEIEDHKVLYDLKAIRGLLESAGFPPEGLRYGHFELGMNCWATATKSVGEGGFR